MRNIQIEEIKARLREAVERGEPRQAQRLATLWVEADALRARVEAELNPRPATPAPVQRARPTDESRKSIQIEISGGAIRQSYLSVTRALRKNLMKKPGPITIRIPKTGAEFETEIVRQGNLLQERAQIAKFYAAAEVAEGDYVVLTQVGPDTWELTKSVKLEATPPQG
jgi:hypothetical protein